VARKLDWKKQKATELRQQGWSYPRIARVLGVHFTTVENWLGKSGVDFSTPETGNPPTITGADGKQYPAAKPKPAQKPFMIGLVTSLAKSPNYRQTLPRLFKERR
jgi:hypothetical protein